MVPALLRERVFRRYWSASTVSMFGDQISGIALPLAAVLVLHAGAAQMGYLTALEWLPSLLFGLHAGAWVDRRGRRRRTMIAADLGRAALFASIPACYALHVLTLPQLYAVTFGAGMLSIMFNVSDATLFVSIVPPERYVDGQSLIYGSRALSFVGGPSIGGMLVQALSAPVAVAADALSFLGSAFFLGRIRPAEPPTDDGQGSVTAGARFIARLGPGPRVADLGGHDQLLQPHVRRALPALRGAGAAHQGRRGGRADRGGRGRRAARFGGHQAHRGADRGRLGVRGRLPAVHRAAGAVAARARRPLAGPGDAVRGGVRRPGSG